MNLIERLQEKGIHIRRNTVDEAEWWMCCPFCSDYGHSPDTKFRLGFNTKTGLAGCFNCGFKTRNITRKLLEKLELGEIAGGAPVRGESRERPADLHLPDDFEELATTELTDPLYGVAVQYLLEKRRVPRWQMKWHGIGASLSGDYGQPMPSAKDRYRILFPEWEDEAGEKLLGWAARDWTGERDPKYKNSTGFKCLYNMPRGRGTVLLVTEGVTKALALERALKLDQKKRDVVAVAILGNSVKDVQVEQMQGPQKAILVPDPDTAGQVGMLTVALNLTSQAIPVEVVWPLPRKQADDYGTEEVKLLLKKRERFTTLLEMQWRTELMAQTLGTR